MEPGVSGVIKSLLAEKNICQPVRIELDFSGCCDSSLCLRLSNITETDLTIELEGLTFIIAPETYQLTGEVTISYVDEVEREGFVLTSSKPAGEWDGFVVSDIKL